MSRDQRQLHSHSELLGGCELRVKQKLAKDKKQGVRITVLKRQGEEYEHTNPRTGKTYKGVVPKRKSYVRIEETQYHRDGLHDFYEKSKSPLSMLRALLP